MVTPEEVYPLEEWVIKNNNLINPRTSYISQIAEIFHTSIDVEVPDGTPAELGLSSNKLPIGNRETKHPLERYEVIHPSEIGIDNQPHDGPGRVECISRDMCTGEGMLGAVFHDDFESISNMV